MSFKTNKTSRNKNNTAALIAALYKHPGQTENGAWIIECLVASLAPV